MSEPVRIALVAEGPTDKIIIEAALQALLPEGTPIILRQIQPDTPEEGMLGGSTDATVTSTGCGWGGVYRWCRSVSGMGYGDIMSVAQLTYDFFIVHLDVDVSRETYTSANISSPIGLPLPCAQPCPPASDSANALEMVVKSWLAPIMVDSRVLWCFPADNTETWGYAAWQSTKAKKINNMECRRDIPSKLKPQVKKTKREYASHQRDMVNNWATVEALCSQAKAFSDAVRTVILPILQ